MKFLATIALSLTAWTAATTSTKSEPQSWRFAHSDAQILAGVDFRALATTETGRSLRDRFGATLGRGLLDQADRMLMSSVLDPKGRRSDIVILSGAFSLANLRKMATSEGAKVVSFKGVEIAAPPGSTAADPHLAWVVSAGDGTTLLIGNRPAIQAAAERAKTNRLESLAQGNRLFERAQELSPSFPVWVSCDTVPAGFAPKAVDALLDSDEENSAVDGMDLGIRAGATADVNLWIWANTEEVADQVLGHLTASVGSKDSFVLAPWLKELKGQIEGSTLALGAPVPAADIAQRVAPLLTAFALPVSVQAAAPMPAPAVRAKVEANVPVTGLPAEAPKSAAPPPPPKKLVVRIAGLDDGDKEIPYATRQ